MELDRSFGGAVRGALVALLAATCVACIGGTGSSGGSGTGSSTPNGASTPNVVPVTVDSGPSAAPGQINHAYVTVRVCAAGSTTACASIDHVRLDTGSVGLRLVGSVLAGLKVDLTDESDAAARTVEECMSFSGGQTWGPIALADVYLAGEHAAKVPVQIMDDTGSGAAAPAACGANGTLINDVAGFGANGVLGLGVLIADCGSACATATTPAPVYFGCTAADACTAENVALALQVTNPVALFAADNNGIIVELPNLVNANGDVAVQGELIFGIGTQSDNALSTTLTILGADASGQFRTTYAGSTLPALIDSGTDAYAFTDATIPACASGAFVGYYCPTVAPQSASAVNTGVGAYTGSNMVDFAIADPNTFVANAAAFIDLAGGGGSTSFTWGMPFFYGRTIYFGFAQRSAGAYSGPFYAY